MSEMHKQIEKLTNERNRARRMYCFVAAQIMYKSNKKITAEHVANNMGWDCFNKEETK
jgi:hypothetical protein